MPTPPSPKPARRDDTPIDTDTLLLIVVGAHPRAELGDRPTAYRLQKAILDRLNAGPKLAADDRVLLTPLVVSDVWYLNDASMRSCPTICIGSPGVNAFSAYLGDKLPSAFCVDDEFMVQLDLEHSDLVACCWGTNAAATAAAVDTFVAKYLPTFLDASVRSTLA